MAGSRTLKLELLAVDKGFARGLRGAQSKTQRFGRGVGKVLGGLALGAGAAAAGLVVLGGKLVEAGERAQTSRARVQNIAESMDLFGDGAEKVTERLDRLADRQARSTGVNQNTIQEAQAIALTFANVARDADQVGGVFDRTNRAALDLAAAGFGSATDNAKQLGKALNDPATGMSALTRSGLTFTEAERARIIELQESNRLGEAQALILEAVESQVGGTAEATADASDKMAVAWSQVQEQLAERVMPMWDAVTAWIADKLPAALDWLEGKLDALAAWWDRHGPTIRDAISNVAEGMRSWWEDTARPAIQNIRDALDRFWNETAKPVLDQLRTAWTENKDTLSDVWEDIQRVLGAFGGLIAEVFSGAEADAQEGTDGIADSLGTFADTLETVTDFAADFAEAFERWGGPLTRAASWVAGVVSPLRGLRDAWQDLANLRSRLPTWLGGTGGGAAPSPSIYSQGSASWQNSVPGLAQGGIVTGPTLAMIGEGTEDEAVLPLSQLERLLDSRAGRGGGTVINVTGAMMDPEGVARAVQEALDRSAARSGAFA